ncbi:MAG: penicillin-binding protein [Deltaproteobacteria bacterium]|nr:penicillin-binding protein [Deltaproteobacteria bacterium]
MTVSRWTRARIVACGVLFGVMVLWVARQAYTLQVKKSEQLKEFADQNYLKSIEIPPSRGRILDRNGKELAATAHVESVFGNPRVLAHVPDAAVKLAAALQMDVKEMRRRLEPRRYFAWLKRKVTPQEAAAVRALQMPGINFRAEPRRFYPLRSLGATVIGHAGSDGRGLEGIELGYESFLRGHETTFQGVKDALGRELLVDGSLDISESIGQDVVLTLDAYLTLVTETALAKALKEHNAKAAMAVMMDVPTGQILAMASLPTFDPNNPDGANERGARNRVITDAFEPGSTMKTFTFAAAFDAGRLKSDELIDCEMGRMKVGKYTIRDTHSLGTVTAAEVYQQSSNIGTVKIARRIGKERLAEALKGFGFGTRSGVGLPGERGGLVRKVDRWGDIGFANVAFGQGLTATPLQITAAFAAVAAGGVYHPPQLGLRVVDGDGHVEPLHNPTASRRVVSEQAARMLLEVMAGVPTPKGTAKLAAVQGYRVAGKTGTAQKVSGGRYDPDKWLASFVGIVPVNNPRLVISVFVDEPRPTHLGGKVAAPVFHDIAEAALKYLNIPPTHPDEVENTPLVAMDAPVDGEGGSEGFGSDTYVLSEEEFFPLDGELPEVEQDVMVSVPNFAGMSLAQSLTEALSLGLEVVPQGSGVAYEQSVTPLRQVPRGTSVRISFRSGT